MKNAMETTKTTYKNSKNGEPIPQGLQAKYPQSWRWKYHTLLSKEAQDALYNAANVGDFPLNSARVQSIDLEIARIKKETPNKFRGSAKVAAPVIGTLPNGQPTIIVQN